ncbi:hypothetical protein BFR75_08590 [Acinetobacter pittii]|uniref:hypothetical protein n=1 Tax=Acinetobacter pittii TaxID=48296 RepID=UPI000837D626|nr:hypothetical protein [Acinetobacter pittii]OCY31909.1 hypothetical protein BFR75_08590 [Acinetobacter pittii]
MEYDKDIELLNLNDIEKNGLQIYRNYTRAFKEQRIKDFIHECDKKEYEGLKKLEQVLGLIIKEDMKYLPIILCSYADERFEKQLKNIIPEGVPGGTKSILDGFGSLSSFSNRIQVAYIFNLIDKEVLLELNSFRKIRNDFAHQWDLDKNNMKLKGGIDSRKLKIEDILLNNGQISDELDEEKKWKCHLIWLVGRIFYETELYFYCQQQRLDPNEVLYAKKSRPQLLKDISKLCNMFLSKLNNDHQQ